MLYKLSRKSNHPIGVTERLKLFNLSKSNLFLIGLFVKVFLIIFFNPIIHKDLFLPFINNGFLNPSINPWDSFLEINENSQSFPYGIIMFGAYAPLSYLGYFIDHLFSTNIFCALFFKLTSLIFDYLSLNFLCILFKEKNNKILLISYWLSPISIYITYLHGQIDIVPITLLLGSLCLVFWNRYKTAGILIAAAISSKFSMLIALPLVFIYIYRLNGFRKEIKQFSFTIFSSLFFLVIPFLTTNSYYQMVLNNKQLDRLYSFYISYSESINVYIVPVVYLITLYLIWRLKKINLDLFLISTGLGFFSILLFIPPAPGWLLWIIPFISYYQIKSNRDVFTTALIYNIVAVINIFLLSSGANIVITDTYFGFESLQLIKNSKVFNLLFTAQQALGLLLAFKMYLYGIKSNNIYKITSKPFVISISGDAFSSINKFANLTHKLFGVNNLDLIIIKNFLNKSKEIY